MNVFYESGPLLDLRESMSLYRRRELLVQEPHKKHKITIGEMSLKASALVLWEPIMEDGYMIRLYWKETRPVLETERQPTHGVQGCAGKVQDEAERSARSAHAASHKALQLFT